MESHRSVANTYKQAKTKSEDLIVKNHDVSSSVLLHLPYFNIVRFHLVDAMHNLLLGTAKNITKIWCESGMLVLRIMQNKMDSVHAPGDVGRIPSNIALSYYGFTADQWRNWTCIFSAVVLKDILPSPHLRCWLLFVKATSILCNRMIS